MKNKNNNKKVLLWIIEIIIILTVGLLISNNIIVQNNINENRIEIPSKYYENCNENYHCAFDRFIKEQKRAYSFSGTIAKNLIPFENFEIYQKCSNNKSNNYKINCILSYLELSQEFYDLEFRNYVIDNCVARGFDDNCAIQLIINKQIDS